MSRHVAVLPDDILQTIATKFNGEESAEGSATTKVLRFLRLPHPRTGLPALFFPPELPDRSKSTILEVQAVTPPNPRSWFMPEGEVMKDGQLLILTPVDPVFLLIPLLRCSCPTDNAPSNFRSAEDLFEVATSAYLQTSGSTPSQGEPTPYSSDDLLRLLSYRCIDSAMRRICEVKEITADIVVYRYSQEKTTNYLKTKVDRLAKPAICETSSTIVRQLAKDGLMDDGKEELLSSARIKAACELLSQYLSNDLYTILLTQYDFAALDAHLQTIQAEQMASIEDTPIPKAKRGKAQSQTGEAAEKKRKAPAKASTGVEKLKKVNVNGMSKISSFFQKPAK
ncbi:ribonuclease H2, subunit B [Fomitopsis serialis]|uniref:ribonuclease H2, subunit B n=1 Tax=Fomitopsis serialis TaxID=139415 RepID=UPI002008B862|nr:ribonuclease H2, subunit B [Neoantrodia serialis]KAH9935311.1 ribonuclease H2, subunit B [Neoantrodia serialis]